MSSKFTKKIIDNDKSPLTKSNRRWRFIIGQSPGKQRSGSKTGIVWQGNRSGDFVSLILGDARRVLLTNVVNYTDITPERVQHGLNDLREDIETFKPSKIVCLGNFSYNYVTKLKLSIPVIKFPHPSWVLRFNKDKEAYAQQLRHEINH